MLHVENGLQHLWFWCLWQLCESELVTDMETLLYSNKMMWVRSETWIGQGRTGCILNVRYVEVWRQVFVLAVCQIMCICLGKCARYSYDILYDCSQGFFVFADQRCTNPGHQLTTATKFCTIVPNICRSSVWNLLHVTLLAPRIWRCLLDFWKICVPLLLIFCLWWFTCKNYFY